MLTKHLLKTSTFISPFRFISLPARCSPLSTIASPKPIDDKPAKSAALGNGYADVTNPANVDKRGGVRVGKLEGAMGDANGARIKSNFTTPAGRVTTNVEGFGGVQGGRVEKARNVMEDAMGDANGVRIQGKSKFTIPGRVTTNVEGFGGVQGGRVENARSVMEGAMGDANGARTESEPVAKNVGMTMLNVDNVGVLSEKMEGGAGEENDAVQVSPVTAGVSKFRPSEKTTTGHAATKTFPDARGGFMKSNNSGKKDLGKKHEDVVKYRVNREITGVPELRLIGPDENYGVVPFNRALELASTLSLDLVEVSPSAQPPVARLLNFDAFLEEKKKARIERQAVMNTNKEVKLFELGPLKEVTMGTNIEHHDFELKKEKMKSFLLKNHPVKLTVKFKRSLLLAHEQRPKKAQELLERAKADLQEFVGVDKPEPKNVPAGMAVKFFYPKGAK